MALVSCICFCQAGVLVRFLIHVSFALRPGRVFLKRLLASVCLPRIAAGADFDCHIASPRRRLTLKPEFHGYLEFYRWFAEEVFDARAGTLWLRCSILVSSPLKVLRSRTHPKPLTGAYAWNLGYIGDTNVTQGAVSIWLIEELR